MAWLARQDLVSTRVYLGSEGLKARPRKRANVKSELTFTIPSKAMIWMVVLVLII